MTACFLRASLFTSVVAFGVALMAAGVGVVLFLLGSALLSLAGCRWGRQRAGSRHLSRSGDSPLGALWSRPRSPGPQSLAIGGVGLQESLDSSPESATTAPNAAERAVSGPLPADGRQWQRAALVAAWATAFVVTCIARGVPTTDRVSLAFWILTGLLAATVGSRRGGWRVLRDWLPVLVVSLRV